MTRTTPRFRWVAGAALAAGTMMVGGWASVIPPVTGNRPTPSLTVPPLTVPPLTIEAATPANAVTPPLHDARHALRTARHRVARRDVTVTKETTDTETTTIVPAAPALAAPSATTTRSVTETTTTR